MDGWQKLDFQRGWGIKHKRCSDNVEPPSKRPKIDYKNTISVLVGPEKTVFTVTKSAVLTRSGYFRVLVRDDDVQVILSELDPTVFESYIHWIYTSEIDRRRMPDDNKVPKNIKPTWMALVKLWELAEYLRDDELCNKLTEMMLDKFEPNPDLVSGLSKVESSRDFFSALHYVLTNDKQDLGNLRHLFTDLYFTGVKQGFAYEQLMSSMSKDTLRWFVRRWARGQEGFEIPQNAVERRECAKRYCQASLGASVQ